jgi:hypothetical protein
LYYFIMLEECQGLFNDTYICESPCTRLQNPDLVVMENNPLHLPQPSVVLDR